MIKQTLSEEIGHLGSGEAVFDRPNSHIQIGDGNLQKFLPLVLQKIDSKNKEFVEITVDFGIEIGKTICVRTEPGDDITFVQREGCKGMTRYVRNKKALPTSLVSVVLKKGLGGYVLITAYFGPKAPPEPWDPHVERESEEFWNTHALVWET